MGEEFFREEVAGVIPRGKLTPETTEFGNLIMGYREKLIIYANRLIGEKKASRSAEDIVQLAFVKALEHQGEFAPGDNVRAWLYTVVRNEVLGDKRKDKRYPQAAEAELDEIGVEHDPTLDLHREQLRGKLQAAIKTLSSEQAEAITLFLSGCPGVEAARQAGVNYSTYKTRLRRAQGHIKDFLIEAGVGLTEV